MRVHVIYITEMFERQYILNYMVQQSIKIPDKNRGFTALRTS